MKVSHMSGSAGRPVGGASGIAALQSRIKELTAELKAVAVSDALPKDKEKQAKLLEAMIQVLQQQIASIQQRGDQEQLLPGQLRDKDHGNDIAAQPAGNDRQARPDGFVDLYV